MTTSETLPNGKPNAGRPHGAFRALMTVLAVALAGGGVSAAEIAFDGGEDGSGTDLSLAANWAGDTLPTAADVATVNCATWPNLTLGGDLALGGLTLSGATGAVTLDGAGRLTLGATGLKFDAAKAFNLKAPVAIAAAQTWTFALGAVNSYATISGTADLVWTKQGSVSFYAAPEYGGSFSCIGRGVRHYTTGKVAAKFTSKLNDGDGDTVKHYDYLAFQGVAHFSDLVSDGLYTVRNWRRTAITVPSTGATNYPTLKIDRDTDVYDAQGPYRLGIANGVVDHSAGEIKTGGYGIAVGMCEDMSGVGVANVTNAKWSCFWQMSGTAKFTGGYVFIGERAAADASATTNAPRFVQTGGTAEVGKCVGIGAATSAGTGSIAEYQMKGGSLQVGISNTGYDHQTRGLVLCHPFGGATRQAGVYTQTGGDATVYGIKFGPDTDAWGRAPREVNNTYGLLSLLGGTLTLHANGTGITFGKGWNKNAAGSASSRINHGGGTLVVKKDITVPTGVFFPQGETAATWNTEGNHVLIDAPISGDGTLRKTGSGRLTLTDANRFTGTLQVDEGEVFVPGASTAAAPSTNENCWVWTADSLVGDYTHGQCVSNWVDHNHGLAATDWATAKTCAYLEGHRNAQGVHIYVAEKGFKGVPTFATNVTFNGHATLRFGHQHLAISPAENPLVDSTNFTIAVAFRPDGTGGNLLWYGSTVLCGGDFQYGCDVPIFNFGKGGRAILGAACYPDGYNRAEVQILSREGKSLAATVNVAVLTVKGLDFTLVTNGGVTNRNFAQKWTYRKMFRRPGANGKAMAFNFGGHFPDEINASFGDCNIAEVRIYKDRSLTVAQQQAIAAEMLNTYRDDGRALYLSEHTGAYEGTSLGEPDQVDPVPCACEWTADSANDAADGSEIASWANTSNTLAATTVIGQGEHGPTLVKATLNGHSALRFSSADKTALGITAGKVPLHGGDFAYAVVFRTKAEVEPAAVNYGKDTGAGIFTTDIATYGTHVGVKMCHEGVLMPMYGWNWVYFAKPVRLNDGLPHVLVFAHDANGNWRMSVDGVTQSENWASAHTSAILPLLIGRNATDRQTGFFTGDIAELRFYDKTLTTDEVASLAEYLGWKYGFRMMAKGVFASRDLAQNRLGATNVTIAAGAKLMLPTSADRASITFGAGETLDLAGSIGGSIALADGATLKVDCAAGVADIDRLVASGNVRLDVRGASAKRPRWLPLVRLGSYDFTGVNWVFDDGGYDTKIEVRDGVLGLVTRHGMLLILR